MTKRSFLGLLFCFLFLFSGVTAGPTWAADTNTGDYNQKDSQGSIETFDLEEIIVTASKREEKAKDASSSISVIDSMEIEASNADYIMDILGTLPGVYVRSDAIYGRQNIEIRGIGSNARRLQTLIDGRPEKMAMFGCTVTQTLPLADIERVELIRGPESVLYGSDAMGGVINIITKRRKEQGFETDFLASYGSNNTIHTLARHGGKIEAFDYYVTYDYKKSDGHRPNSEYKGYDTTVRLGYQFSDNIRVEGLVKDFSDEYEDPGPELTPYTNNDKGEYNRTSWDLDLIGEWDRVDASVTIYQNKGHHQFNMPSASDFWHSKDKSTGVSANVAYTIYDTNDINDVFSMGYEYEHQWATTLEPWDSSVSSPPYHPGEYERDVNDIYFLNNLKYMSLTVDAGARAHYEDVREEWKLVPQLGMTYQASDATRLRAKVSEGFRDARFNELFLFPAANDELEPEDLWSYEIGVVHTFNNMVSISVDAFYMNVKNMIQTVVNPNPPPMRINQNSDSFYIRGVETGIDLRMTEDLSGHFYHTYTDIEDVPGTGHANLEGNPKNLFEGGLEYQWARLSLSWNGQYVTDLYDENLVTGDIEEVDDFFVADMKATYRFNDNLQVFGSLENMFDKDYEMIPGYPMPGLSFYSGVRISF